MIEMTILAWQARILLGTGLAWLAIGCWLQHDPLTVAWRAAAGALVVMVLSGALLRLGARIIHRLAVAEIQADPELQSEAAHAT